MVASHKNEVSQLERDNEDSKNHCHIFGTQRTLEARTSAPSIQKFFACNYCFEDAAWNEVIAKAMPLFEN